MSDGSPMVELRGLSKRFGRRPAVHPLDLVVPRGSVFGLLGHNGAGKSTVLGMLLGQVFPDAGEVLIERRDVFAERRSALARVGAIFETPCFYDYLSGRANLKMFSAFSDGATDAHLRKAVQRVGLEDRIGDSVGTYSHGMRQRLALAQALVPLPELLILDEPGDGLDPEAIRDIRHIILELNRDLGITILFSSHQLHEVEQVCTHVAVMREGRLLYAGPWDRLGREAGWLQIDVSLWDEAVKRLRESGMILDASPGQVRCVEGVDAAAVNRWLVEAGFDVRAIGPRRQGLEAFYMELIRRGQSEAQAAVTTSSAGGAEGHTT